MKHFKKIKPLNESTDLVKEYVPDFETFIEDPDKWLSQLPQYEDNDFSNGDDGNSEIDNFENSDSDLDLGDDLGQGDDDFGSDLGQSEGDDLGLGDDDLSLSQEGQGQGQDESFLDTGQEEPTQDSLQTQGQGQDDLGL